MFALLAFANLVVSACALAHTPRRSEDTSSFENLSTSHQNGSHILPDVASVLVGPEMAHKSLNSKIEQIQSQLAAMQSADIAAVANQKKEYIQRLEAQKSEIVNAKALNTRTKSVLEEVIQRGQDLRRNASILAMACQKVRRGLSEMEANLTSATEFIQQTMNASGILLNASEVQIMAELDMADALLQQRMVRSKRLNSIGLLQVPQQVSPSDVVQSLLASFEEVTKQKEANMANLKTAFEHHFQSGVDQLRVLQDEYMQLKFAVDVEIERNGKLVTAVTHLGKTYEELARRRQALRGYVHSIGTHSAVRPVASD